MKSEFPRPKSANSRTLEKSETESYGGLTRLSGKRFNSPEVRTGTINSTPPMYKRVDGRQKRLELEESESPPAGCGRFFPVALETITDPSKTATNPNG